MPWLRPLLVGSYRSGRCPKPTARGPDSGHESNLIWCFVVGFQPPPKEVGWHDWLGLSYPCFTADSGRPNTRSKAHVKAMA